MFVVLAPLVFNSCSPFWLYAAQQGRGSGKLDVTVVFGTLQLILNISGSSSTPKSTTSADSRISILAVHRFCWTTKLVSHLYLLGVMI